MCAGCGRFGRPADLGRMRPASSEERPVPGTGGEPPPAGTGLGGRTGGRGGAGADAPPPPVSGVWAMFEKCQHARTASLFPSYCVDFPCNTPSIAASNRLVWRKNPSLFGHISNFQTRPRQASFGAFVSAWPTGPHSAFRPASGPEGRSWRPCSSASRKSAPAVRCRRPHLCPAGL